MEVGESHLLAKLKSRMQSGSLWALFGEVISGGVRAVSYLVYARLLTPADFGLAGFALIITSMFHLVVDNSLGLTVIRQANEEPTVYSTIFFMNVGLSLCAVAALFALAPSAASFIHDDRMVYVLPIMSLQLLANSLSSIPIAVARKRFLFKQLVPVRLAGSLMSLAIGIPLAIAGRGVWALVGASVGVAVGQLIASLICLDWRPSWTFSLRGAQSVSKFAAWISVDMGVTWLVMSGGAFFLAFFLGAAKLGMFRLSDHLDAYLMGAILMPLIPVLYSSFCEVAERPEAYWKIFQRSSRVITSISLGLGGIIIVAARPISRLIGGQWHGIADILVLNAFADAVSNVTMGIPALMRATGRVKIVAAIRAATVIVQVIVYAKLAPMGLKAFLLGKLSLESLIYVASFVVLRKSYNMPVKGVIRNQLGQVFFASMCIVAAFVVLRYVAFVSQIERLIVGVAVFFLSFGLYVLIIERKIITEVLGLQKV